MIDAIAIAAFAGGFLALGAYLFGGPPVRPSLQGNFWTVPIGLLMLGTILLTPVGSTDCEAGFGARGAYSDC